MEENKLHTVCEEARCPNIGECWNSGTATFMILGDVCTRSCGFCNVKTGMPIELDSDEPRRVADAVTLMKLQHAVITSVNRDELYDGGSFIFAETIREVRKQNPQTTIEVLIPDFKGDEFALINVLDAFPDILNHNMETVPRLYSTVRPQAKYERSLELLERAKRRGFKTKTGIMVGLGEREEEVVQTMNTLIQQGKILYWGTSEWSGVEIMEAHRVAAAQHLIGPCVEQPQYNLFERTKMENEYLEIFKNVGMGTTIWSPLASGLLTGKYNDGIPEGSRFHLEGFEWLRDRLLIQASVKKVQQLAALAKALKVSTASLSIAWCIKNPNVSTAILGATNKTQLLDNLSAIHTASLLTPAIMEQIEDIVETKPKLPEW